MTFLSMSFVMCVIWSTIFVMLFSRFRKKTEFFEKYGLTSLLILGFVCILRSIIIIPANPNFMVMICETDLYPYIVSLFKKTVFEVGNISLAPYQIILAIWFSGSFIVLLGNATNYFKYTHKINRLCSLPIYREENLLKQIIGEDIFLKKAPKIIKSENVDIPHLMGFVKPTIILPATEYTKQEVHFILQHEWNHFRNKDILVKLFAGIIVAFFWWNPFMWRFIRDLSQILEMRCDLAITKNATSEDKISYLETQIKVIKNSFSKNTIYSLTAFGVSSHKADMAQRFHVVLNDNNSRKKSVLPLIVFIVSLLFLLICSYMIVLQPHAGPVAEGSFKIWPLSEFGYH